ncbi:MAG TPA: translation initiation factor IF-2 [Candidatus Nanoarchaeia archaeon]|nr:translation initiation factor IF-2 [Candidatus Nanoarchaeia archaeon]
METKALRQVIVTILGNVDSGKSKIIETIKKTSILEAEPGKITQSIKAYAVAMSAIQEMCKGMLDASKVKVPGLLFLDTPGHKAFANLRRRGGSLADIAILVIDVNEGIKPQTLESIEILKAAKTPFVVALNKIDLLPGWQSKREVVVKDIASQPEAVRSALETRLYKIVAELYEQGLNAERFDRVEDYTKQLVMIPVSAKTGEGIPELLVCITGLAQKFLESSLAFESAGPGKGTVLEVVEEKGFGTTLDVMVYDGHVKVSDQIVVGTLQKPVVSKVKALLIPEDGGLKQVKEVSAAVGVKVAAPGLGGVIPGMPLLVANKEVEKAKVEVMSAVEELTLELDDHGIVVKADALGSLEALLSLLREKGVKIKRASIGPVSKKDVAEAASESDSLNRVVLAFKVKTSESDQVRVFSGEVIYTLLEKFEAWLEKEKESVETEKVRNLVWPCKVKILEGYIFHQSNPAIVGVEVLAGRLRPGTPLLKEKPITTVKGIQHEGKSVNEAKKGQAVAVSLPGVTINRQVKEGDVLYADVPEEHFKALKRLKKYLNDEEVQVLKELAEIKRKENAMWGM